MINNPALDVAIGLIFIYAIYSLLATTLTELIATWIGLRGKTLRKGIKRMLDDDPDSEKNDIIPLSKLSNNFLDRPEIKFLGKGKNIRGKEKFPSYIKPKTFAKGLMNSLEEAHQFQKDFNKLQESLEKSKTPTSIFIANLIDEANSNAERFKSLTEDWYNETMDRVSGWYKKWISFITLVVGFLIAISMGVDTISISKKLSNDEKVRLAMVDAASMYVGSFKNFENIEAENLEKIDVLTARIDSILVQVQASENILDMNAPEELMFFEDDARTKETWLYILGCFLTAIAMSVGAPFWFDLLNKLIQLRGSGAKESTSQKQNKKEPVG